MASSANSISAAADVDDDDDDDDDVDDLGRLHRGSTTMMKTMVTSDDFKD
jgi:hypothetical protein